MNTRERIRDLLLLLAFGSLVYLAGKELVERGKPVPAEAAPATSSSGATAPKLIVYYFSEGKQCATCENLALYTREALDTYFPGELASGIIAWRPIDVDERANDHYVSEYGIYTKSVVLARMEDGKQIQWKNLEAVWDYVYNKPAFLQYVRTEAAEYLDAAP